MQNWLESNWGNVASIVGLIVSIAVLIVSGGARKAARQAKQILERRSIASDLRACTDDVALLNVLFDTSKWEIAGHIAYKLVQAVAFIQSRWTKYLDTETHAALGRIVLQIDTIHEQVVKFQTNQPSAIQREALGKAITNVNTMLTTETGKHEGILEES